MGIGINIDGYALPDELAGKAGAVALRTGFDRNRLAAAVVSALCALDPLNAGQDARTALVEEYRSRSIALGREVVFESSGETLAALARSIDDDGALVVEMPDRSLRTLHGGEVSLHLNGR